MKTSVVLLLLALVVTSAHAQAPGANWFGRQHNAFGLWCCDEADGHLYDGAYTINRDGSVTIPADGGGTITIDAGKVLPYNPKDPNPTGAAVIWFTGKLTSGWDGGIYCFSIGPLG